MTLMSVEGLVCPLHSFVLQVQVSSLMIISRRRIHIGAAPGHFRDREHPGFRTRPNASTCLSQCCTSKLISGLFTGTKTRQVHFRLVNVNEPPQSLSYGGLRRLIAGITVTAASDICCSAMEDSLTLTLLTGCFAPGLCGRFRVFPRLRFRCRRDLFLRRRQGDERHRR
jgi:hypothetical protein